MTSSNEIHPSSLVTIPTKSKRTTHPILWALTLIALVSAGFAIFKSFQNQQNTTAQLSPLVTEIKTIKQSQVNETNQMNGIVEKLEKKNTELAAKLKALDTHLKLALQDHSYGTNDWLLLKARYYLELAEITAHWSDERQVITALLDQADTLLSTIPGQNLFSIRQAIANEIATLVAIPSIDTVGILSKLDAAQAAIDTVPIKQTMLPKTTDKTSSSIGYKKTLAFLEKLVTIRHHDEAVQPILTPIYESVLRETMRLNLQEAQWAVLHKNDAAYHLFLNQAILTLTRSFQMEDIQTQSLINLLRSLEKNHLITQTFVPEESLKLLNQLIQSKSTEKRNALNTEEH